VGTNFFHFVTIDAFGRQMDILTFRSWTALHRCSAVKTVPMTDLLV